MAVWIYRCDECEFAFRVPYTGEELDGLDRVFGFTPTVECWVCGSTCVDPEFFDAQAPKPSRRWEHGEGYE
jgi:hypothetical protein